MIAALRPRSDAQDGSVTLAKRDRDGGLRHFSGRRGALAVLLVGLVGLGLVGAGAWVWHSRNLADRETQVRALAESTSGNLSRALLQYRDLLSGSGALFNQDQLTRVQYVEYLQAEGFGTNRFPGLVGIGFVQFVLPGEVAGFLDTLSSQGIAASLDPPGQRSQYCLGSYADWKNLAVSVPLFGYDVCTVPALSQVLSKATATGEGQILKGSTLDKAYSSDFLMIQPVYKGLASSTSARAQLITGWAIAITDGPQLLESIRPPAGLELLVKSSSSGSSGTAELLRWPASLEDSGNWNGSYTFDVGGTWTLRFRATSYLVTSGTGSGGPVAFLVVGLVAVLLLVAFLWSLLGTRSRAVQEADRATASLRLHERRFERLVDNSSDVIAVVNDRAELVYANPAGKTVLGLEPASELGNDMLELIHRDDRRRAADAFARDISEPGTHPPSVYRFRTATDEWRFLELKATNCLEDPAVRGVVMNVRDVTESTNLARALRTLARANEILIHASQEPLLLQDTCRAIAEAGDYPLAWVGYVEHDDEHSVKPVASAGCSEYLGEICASWADDEYGHGPIGEAIRTRSVQNIHDLRKTKSFANNRESATRFGLRANCVLPLEVGAEVVGILAIYASEPNAFGRAEVGLLRELAGSLAYGIGRIRDASSLEESEARFRILAATAPIGILEVSRELSVVFANPRMSEITGRTFEDLMRRGWIDAIEPDDLPALMALIDRVSPEREKLVATFRVRRPDGETRHVKVLASPKGAEVGSGYVVTVEDVSEEVRAQEELAHQAFYDTLTGLPNRALLLDRLNQELSRRRRNGSSVALLFLDLDRFKTVNDSLGHDTGDLVLKVVADRFKHVIRAGETAARFSGDEFVFIVRDIRQTDDAHKAAKRILDVLEVPIRAAGQELVVTGSIGLVIPERHIDAATVLRNADTAMYQAKEAGRNRIEVFDESLHYRMRRRLEVEAELRRALDLEEFELHYQPGIDLESGMPMAAEALVRWHHPERGMVAPLDFIPVAEELGLIVPIGRWVLEKSLAQLAAWDANADGPRLGVLGINLSARQLDDSNTPDLVSALLERYAIVPGRVALEVTESVIMSDGANTRRSLRAFKDLGLRVAIDDFGTGYSSLAYLHTLPVTTVKIDRSFVVRLEGPDNSVPVVKAIVDMSHAMGLRVVAEGVSDERLCTLVREIGCDVAQGYYWTKPLPVDTFEKWWRGAEALNVPSAKVSRSSDGL